MSRLRGLYFSLAFLGILALYWISGLENKDAISTFKQPDIKAFYGRGLKTKFSEKQISILPDAVNNVSKEQISKSTSALPVTKKMEAEEPIPIGEVLKSKEGFQVHKKKKVQLEKLRQRTRPNPRTIFSLADYKPGKSSKPLKYGLDLTLTRLNMEFGRDEQSAKANVASRYFKPSFSPKAGKSMEMVGGIKVGQDVPNHSARHVLVLTTWRSGSTFLGDLLNHYKGTFYYFEPLHYYSKSKNNPSLKNPVQNETDFLKSLYHCQFDENNLGFLHHVSKSDNKFLFKNHNFRLWNSCEHLLPNDMMCLMPEYLNKVCPKFPIKLIKTVRLQMRNIEELITDATLGLKVIFLVRDPRGTYNSRSSGTISKWCIRDECANPAVGCEQLLDNVNVAFDLERRFPGTVKLVRYEDLSMFTEDTTMDLLDFIGLPFTQEISSYIDSHTNSDKVKIVRNKKTHKLEHKSNPYGTARNSTATAFAWREKLSFENIRKIQSACEEPMRKLGYTLYQKEEEVSSPTLPLNNDLEKIWPFATP